LAGAVLSRRASFCIRVCGSVVLEIELKRLQEIERSVLSWGKHAHVVAPKELATRIRDEATAIAKLYRG
jgi:predicted DNA-binding transcriptional regulator YafY